MGLLPFLLVPPPNLTSCVSSRISHKHTNGFVCHENSLYRKVEMHFVCLPTLYSPQNELQYTLSLEETDLCEYRAVFSTPLMCPNFWGSVLTPLKEEAKPAVKTDAPSVKIDAPAAVKIDAPLPTVKTDAPAVKTDAPVVKTDAPVVKIDAPAIKTDAPTVKIDAPAVKIDAPSVKIDAPDVKIVKIDAPAVKTDAPTVKIDAPAAESDFPMVEDVDDDEEGVLLKDEL